MVAITGFGGLRRLVIAALSIFVLAGPIVAQAYVGQHGSAKIKIFRQTIGHGEAISNQLILDCDAVTLSTVNRNYGVVYFSGFTASKSSECDRVGYNGLDFVHFAHGRWHNTWEGSDVPCHIRGVPQNAARDLFRSLPRGFGPSPNCR
jgi:hypothetical protein